MSEDWIMDTESVKEFYEEHHSHRRSHFLGRVMQRTRVKVLRCFLKDFGSKKDADGEKILIVGCGSGEDVFVTDQKIYGLDLSLTAISSLKRSKSTNYYICGDATSLPFEAGKFDIVICSEVIEHIPNAKKAILEFHRVLAFDGKLLLTTPNWLSFYGLARKLAEAIMRAPVTAGGQPIDNWYTYKTLVKLLLPQFTVVSRRGIWYFPPTGRGMRVIPAVFTYPAYLIFRPFEEISSRILPGLGHTIAVVGQKVAT